MSHNHLLYGDICCISIISHEIFHLNIRCFLVVLNIPFVIMGYKKIGITCAVQVIIAVALLAIFINLFSFDIVTKDKILFAIFGGFLMGLGVGFVITGGGVIDGFEVVAHYTNKKLGLSPGEIFLFVHSIILLLAAFNFGIEEAMYSILTYFTEA